MGMYRTYDELYTDTVHIVSKYLQSVLSDPVYRKEVIEDVYMNVIYHMNQHPDEAVGTGMVLHFVDECLSQWYYDHDEEFQSGYDQLIEDFEWTNPYSTGDA